MTKQTLQTEIDELEKLSNEFSDQENIDLETAVDKYEKAAKLLKKIKKQLEGIELRINEIKATYDEEEVD